MGDLSCEKIKHLFTVPNIVYYFCENCGEKLTDAENEIKIDQYFFKQLHKAKRAA